jgi:tetratricopeptide (TPR) repeat protein
MKRSCHILPLLIAIGVAIAITSCSNKKNTAQTRWWQAFTAKYNTYYNGTLAYIDASLEKENGNRDNYTELLPLYTVGNKASRELGKSNYETAIEKCQKTIKLHSITARPEWKKSRKKTARDIEWLNRKEYNPFLWRAWMLMGRSQFYKGDFDEAASTFTYMCRLYKTQPAIYGKARAWLAKCYIEQDWIYDAEDVIRNMQRDSIDWRAQKEWDYTYADYYLHIGDMENAAKYLRKVVKHEMRSKQRAREYYLLGQVEAALGRKDEAYKAFKKVIRQNPPYEVEFNARIAMTEVLADGTQARKMISRLKRMASDENNKEYLDQVYYAIGNIYLTLKDTTQAIYAYEAGNKKATRSGIEKGVLLLHLGDLYWAKEKYGDAGRCYGEAIGLLDKDRDDYEQLSERSKILDELTPYTNAVELQDSLQLLAKMSEKDRNAAIDRVITALKKKEKEERDREAEENVAAVQEKYDTGQRQNNNFTQQNNRAGGRREASWYFYNPTTVQQGKQAFARTWGKRDNVDNWQRANKSNVGDFASEDAQEQEYTEEQRDSIAAVEEKAEKEKARLDTAANDPHKREYYLAQIPFTPEQLEESNAQIEDGLFHSGIIFKDKLDNLNLSEKSFMRLLRDFPETQTKDEVYYHMFLLYSRKGDNLKAHTYLNKMKNECADSKWTTILTDPYFEDNAKYGTHLEDSLYAATYEAFKNDRFEEVRKNTSVSDKRFPLGDNRDKFLFISGLSQLNEGDADGCLARLDTLVKAYPQSKVSELAGMIINGVRQGRTLMGGNFSMEDVWNRRTAVMSDKDTTNAKGFSDERNTEFTFMFVYNPDSISENKLLFQLARFNFTNFVVRNFNIEIADAAGLHHMMVTGFRSFDEARQYARVLYKNDGMMNAAKGSRSVVISNENLPMLGTQYSYNDYDAFYTEHFQPLKADNPYMLYEPDYDEKEIEKDLNRRNVNVNPALPSETVAPNGAAPVSGSENADDEDDTNTSFGLDMPQNDVTIPQNDIITISEDPTSTVPSEIPDAVLDLPATSAPEQPQQEEDTIFGIPTNDTPAQPQPQTEDTEVILDLPATTTPEQPQQEEDAVFGIPTNDTPAQQQPQTEDTEVILDLPITSAPEQPQQEEDAVFGIPTNDTPAQPQPQNEDTEVILDLPTTSAPEQPQQQEDNFILEDNTSENNNTQTEDTILLEEDDKKTDEPQQEENIILDDSQKEDSKLLEDEYYELDGF